MTPRLQRTLAGSAETSGFGYWNSLDITIQFHPAPPDTGIVFVRTDLPSRPRVPALEAYRFDVPRRTNLQYGPARVDMVEHVLAALAGLQVDNCEVWCDETEMPGPDGSSLMFVEAIESAGIVEQNVLRKQFAVCERLRVEDTERGTWVEIEPYDGQYYEYQLDFGEGPIGAQTFGLDLSPESFVSEIAGARTFILKQEAEWLQTQKLGLRASNKDLLVFDADGPIENTLRYKDECVRHKTLDMVGDFALTGFDIVGKLTAHRSGHRLNADLVRKIVAQAANTAAVT